MAKAERLRIPPACLHTLSPPVFVEMQKTCYNRASVIGLK
jgi:hypothetical protein